LPDSVNTADESGEQKQDSTPAFDVLARHRKSLQQFCHSHLPSVGYFLSKNTIELPIFRLSDDENELKHFRHITSTATCYASIEECPAKFRPTEEGSPDFKELGLSFAKKAIDLSPSERWKSDGAAGIYCSARGLPFVLSKLDTWHSKIDEHLARIFYQLQIEPERFAIGEADKAPANATEAEKAAETKSWYKPNAYHTYWTLEVLRMLQKFQKQDGYSKSTEVAKALAYRPQLLQWARQQLGFQISLHTAWSSLLDSDQLAWSLAILISQPQMYQSNLAEQDFIRQGFKCLFSTQEKVGTWRHYGPLFHYPHAGNAYCYVFETFAAILNEALKPGAEFVRNTLREYSKELFRLWEYAISAQTKRPGGQLAWSSGHRIKPTLESWATASVFAYAQGLRRLIGLWTADEALSSLNYRPTFPTQDEAKKKLLERSSIWSCTDLAERLTTMFINTVAQPNRDQEEDPDEPLIRDYFPCSAIFFGPPGTSKTKLVSAIAGSIGWKYIELHPSHFVADGLPQVQQTADVIFRKLMELDHAVVLFDEIDELVRERDIEPDQFGRFLTTSMLPRLAELWKGRKVMYFVATNHIEYFDRAVTRSERFDAIIFMSPPAFSVKVDRLTRILKDTYHSELVLSSELTQSVIDAAMPEKECNEAAEKSRRNSDSNALKKELQSLRLPPESALAKFVLLRWDELDELAFQIARLESKDKITLTKDNLAKALGNIADGSSRSMADYCRFRIEQQTYERFDRSRKARWIVREIDGVAGVGARLPEPVIEENGAWFIDTTVGPADQVNVKGYSVERAYIEGKGLPGVLRLKKKPAV